MIAWYDKLKSIPDTETYLKSDDDFEILDEELMEITANAFVELRQNAETI